MTHEYTILTGGVVVPGGDRPACTAIAWAADTVLALGSDAEVLAISHGGSAVVPLEGRMVVPLAVGGVLEVGGPADIAVLAAGARAGAATVVAQIRNGQLAAGELAGLDAHDPGHHDDHGNL